MEGVIMANETRYGKPNMLNMPAKWGRRVIHEIKTSPPTDLTLLKKESDEFEKEFIIDDKEKD